MDASEAPVKAHESVSDESPTADVGAADSASASTRQPASARPDRLARQLRQTRSQSSPGRTERVVRREARLKREQQGAAQRQKAEKKKRASARVTREGRELARTTRNQRAERRDAKAQRELGATVEHDQVQQSTDGKKDRTSRAGRKDRATRREAAAQRKAARGVRTGAELQRATSERRTSSSTRKAHADQRRQKITEARAARDQSRVRRVRKDRSGKPKERLRSPRQIRRDRQDRRERRERQDASPTGIHPSIWLHPRPLVDAERNLAVLWSPKSGCTFIAKWFFDQVGLLDQAEKDFDWIHTYRREYYRTPQYTQSIARFSDDPTSFRIVRLVRDPYRRAVSSYIQFLSHSTKENRAIDVDRVNLWNGATSMSFREFVAGLETADLREVNVHWGPQMHHSEADGLVVATHIIHLEDSMDRLAIVEQELNLPALDLSRFRESKHHASFVDTDDSFVGDTTYDGSVRDRTPGYDRFYDQDLRDRVYNLYRADFETYGYPKDPAEAMS